MLVTLDASVAAAWVLADEASSACDAILANAINGVISLQAPGLWSWETGNLLRMATLRKRIDRRDWPLALLTLRDANVRLEALSGTTRMQDTLAIAASTGLTFYDASYLEQAHRTGASLATQDKSLRKAAATMGVKCLQI